MRAEEHAPGEPPTVVELVEPGGHRTFRVLFDPATTATAQDALLEAINAAGGTFEGTGADREGVYGIDVAPEQDLRAVEAVLQSAADDGLLRFELGGATPFLDELDVAVGTQNRTARHAEPLVAAGAAELVLAGPLEHPLFPELRFEQLWARPAGDDRAELLSAAFLAYELHVGDVVLVEREDARRLPRVAGVAQRSGRWLLRVRVDDETDPEAIEAALRERGARVERSERWPRYLAVDAADDEHAVALRAWLDAQEEAGVLGYETAWP